MLGVDDCHGVAVVAGDVVADDADAFKKNADVFARYLGPVSTVTPVSSLSAGPDFLVEIEAVAVID